MKKRMVLQIFAEDGETSGEQTAEAAEESVQTAPAEESGPQLMQESREAQLHEGAERIYAGWMEQAERLKQLYPGFDIRQEMADPRFCRLLGSQVDMQTAFEVIHNREIIPAVMQYAARTVEQRLASSMRFGLERPVENGIRDFGAVMLGSNAAGMSRKEFSRVCRMVERGERVSFG